MTKPKKRERWYLARWDSTSHRLAESRSITVLSLLIPIAPDPKTIRKVKP